MHVVVIPMSMTFRYLDSSNPNGDVYKRPSILATFSNGQERLELYALVDSGADMSAMDYRVAEKLHLDLSGKKVMSFGVSGSVESVVTEATVEVSKAMSIILSTYLCAFFFQSLIMCAHVDRKERIL